MMTPSLSHLVRAATLACSFLSAIHISLAERLEAQDIFDSPTAAEKNASFAMQGEYTGANLGVQAVAVGDDEFEIVVYAGGLPGAGWDRTEPTRIEGDASTLERMVQSRKLLRIERKSPTLLQAPPPDAVLLFDGTQASINKHWKPGAKLADDGTLQAGATTQELFNDYSIHVEFRTPFQPKAEGQARGNSGVYHQGRYEMQILDSFGLTGKNNEAGGIYEVSDPILNACFPPLTWQTYDADFTAARFDAEGKKIADALVTVRLNGIVVQQNVAIPHATRAAPLAEAKTPGPIYLQDHGNPVRFRNIWIVPRDVEQEAKRPRIAGVERFPDDEITAGNLLITQLACAACHESSEQKDAPKQSPILSSVGSRLRLDALLQISTHPHRFKPGTTMPDLFHGLTQAERDQRGRAIASFLASTGALQDRPGDKPALERGEELYHSIGCVACHDPRRPGMQKQATSVPLGDLTSKYSVDGLSRFLVNPHAVRPDGAMPKLVQSMTEARDLACYLLGEKIVAAGAEQFAVKLYYGSWEKLPDFAPLKPIKTGTTNGLDIGFAGRKDDFAMVFEAYLPVAAAGTARFFLGSDDGSRVLIDGKEVVNYDGIHPHGERTGRMRLEAGVHELRVEYFEKSGEESLSLEIELPESGRAPAAMLVTTEKEPSTGKLLIPATFQPDETLVETGREYFVSSGCANCHAMEIKMANANTTARLKSTASAKKMRDLNWDAGCMSAKPPKEAPQFALSSSQRRSILAAVRANQKDQGKEAKIHFELASKNCYACHKRGDVGGLEATRDTMFLTKTPEMGNEGRVPPPLTNVGDKLRPDALKTMIEQGVKDRPYMLTRMPGFGKETAERLRDWMTSVDRQGPGDRTLPSVDSPHGAELVVAGRTLVGNDGLACIKCHVYGDKATPGIQAMNLLRMTERLRDDWFHRYMLDPQRYRPGTRMPLSFPDGKSVLEGVLQGNADQQIDAMWMYLSLGKSAKSPNGLDGESIVLKPGERPVIYRNFIEGLSPRGIAVGYPERVNIAWDADTMSLNFLWKNDFIDASKHWVGRGPGNQGPLGDFVVSLEKQSPIAGLDSLDAPWPVEKPKARGYRFRGYKLSELGQPTFEYLVGQVPVTDLVLPKPMEGGRTGMERTLTVDLTNADKDLVFRAAVGSIQALDGDNYQLDKNVRLHIQGVQMKIVPIGNTQELRGIVPKGKKTTILQSIAW